MNRQKVDNIPALRCRLAALALFVLGAFPASAQQHPSVPERALNDLHWTAISSGVEYTAQKIIDDPVVGDGVLHLVRIDPAQAKLRLLMASSLDRQLRTAKTWCSEFGMAAVINAGMFEPDHLTHVGYMRNDDQINNAKWAKQYSSILAFGPVQPGKPFALILDADADPLTSYTDYASVIQNLRLIKGDGKNVWSEQPKKWSEAAIAMDNRGRVLFLFIRSPLSMHEFNEKILKLPLNISRAMHLEGGPEASLSVCTAARQLHLAGEYESGLIENDSNHGQWPLPNVIGVLAEKHAK